jgi:ribosome recycling factor
VADASLITIQPWDPTQIDSIIRAILTSDLGLNPSTDGRIIRVPVPPLTEERRRQLAKHVGKVTEQHRTALRNIRRNANDLLKKMSRNKAISEDEEHRGYDQVQKTTDDFIGQADDLGRQKENEVLEV